MPRTLTRALLLAYGLLNAVLYSSLLPLWEGFDEEFHYGYVRYLVEHHSLPRLGATGLPEQINESIRLQPMSYVMSVLNLHAQGIRTFDQYFALSSAERHALRDQTLHIPPSLSGESARFTRNYELHHGPLAYFLMAIPDRLLNPLPLLRRVWLLRLLVSIASVFLTWAAALALGKAAGLGDYYSSAMVFLLFSCQMFWATVAHIGNDWLAIPLAIWLIAELRRERPKSWPGVSLGLVLALGLLTKAYFLVFLPVVLLKIWNRPRLWPACFGIPALLAGPWYLRNLLLYRNLSGRVEESSGVTFGAVLKAWTEIPWLHSIPFMLRGTFWMGNGSFTDFSVRTMNLVLILLALSLALYCRTTARSRQRDEVFLWLPVALFCAAMIYVTGSSYVYNHGSVTVASPWYMQAVMAPLLCLAMLGCQRSGKPGTWLATGTIVLWSYILAATYLAKLIPLYGGFPGGRSTLRDLWIWYRSSWGRTADILDTTALAPAAVLVPLLAALLVILLLTAATLCSFSESDKQPLR